MRQKMKGSKIVKILIIGVLVVAVVLGFYYYLNHKEKEVQEESAQITAVQNVLLKDLERSYPPTPKEVVKYYSEITKCFYNEEYSEEELLDLAQKIQELYDAELIANKTQEEYLTDLKSEIAQMKEKKCIISSYEISASTDVEFFTQNGYSCARLYCTYYLKQDAKTTSTMECFVLRQDEEKHWKILGWDLAE